jgi:hypothetical protein
MAADDEARGKREDESVAETIERLRVAYLEGRIDEELDDGPDLEAAKRIFREVHGRDYSG